MVLTVGTGHNSSEPLLAQRVKSIYSILELSLGLPLIELLSMHHRLQIPPVVVSSYLIPNSWPVVLEDFSFSMVLINQCLSASPVHLHHTECFFVGSFSPQLVDWYCWLLSTRLMVGRHSSLLFQSSLSLGRLRASGSQKRDFLGISVPSPYCSLTVLV